MCKEFRCARGVGDPPFRQSLYVGTLQEYSVLFLVAVLLLKVNFQIHVKGGIHFPTATKFEEAFSTTDSMDTSAFKVTYLAQHRLPFREEWVSREKVTAQESFKTEDFRRRASDPERLPNQHHQKVATLVYTVAFGQR